MNKLKPIGGYFGLELSQKEEYHKDAIRLNTGRNSLEYILKVKQYDKIYIPYYTCEVVLEPINKLNIEYGFYSINERLEPIINFEIKDNEAIILNNYFGITGHIVNKLSQSYKNIIIDNSQAFFEKALTGFDTFYSARKFFGVPDGAYLYCDKKLEADLEQDLSYQRFEHLLGRVDINPQSFYNNFKNNNILLQNQDIKQMSNVTQAILNSIDYHEVADKRMANFNYLHKNLGKTNLLKLNIDESSVPMVYPYLIENGKSIKQNLIDSQIYVATYWSNVLEWAKRDAFEHYLTKNLIALPIDQRYGVSDMQHIINMLR